VVETSVRPAIGILSTKQVSSQRGGLPDGTIGRTAIPGGICRKGILLTRAECYHIIHSSLDTMVL